MRTNIGPIILIHSFISLCLLSGCITVTERGDENRPRKELTLEVSNDFTVESWESEKNLWHPSGFRVLIAGKVLYIDPVDIIDPIPADYILITHSHGDHLSPVEIEKILKPETVIVCPKSVKIAIPNARIERLNPGEIREFGAISVEAVPAYNFFHPKILGFNGYIIAYNGIRLYHAGDTGLIREMKNIHSIAVAMVPIGTGNLAMNPEEAARAINTIHPQIAIPMHYEIKNGKAEKFQSLVNQDIRVEIMEDE